MKWITRSHVHVDRVACPWLIRKFIDESAEFIFAVPTEIPGIVKKTDAIPYDTEGAELGHHGDKCSFDAFIDKYRLEDEALHELAEIVRAADTKHFELAPESVGLTAIADGANMIFEDDNQAIEKGAYVYDALYTYCRLRKIKEKHKAEVDSMDGRKRRELLRKSLGLG